MRCTYIKKNGEKCRANAIIDSVHCFWHSSKIKESKKQEVRSKGGKGNKLKIRTPMDPIEIKKPFHVIVLLEDTINKVRRMN